MSDAEADAKRRAALQVAGSFVTNDPADVRWLLCGRGRPVSAGSASYAVELGEGVARVWYQDIELSRVEAEERWNELGYAPTPYPWYEPLPVRTTAPALQRPRLELRLEEVERYRRAASDAAEALVDVLQKLHPRSREVDATAEIAERLVSAGFATPVLLAGGESRAPVHRHPLPTDAPLGAFALLAFTAERHGLHVSMTRIVSFGSPPAQLRRRVEQAAEVDAAVIAGARPGATLAEVFAVLRDAYAKLGLPDEWRLHHQGGLTGYKGREVFATPKDRTVLPPTCAVAFNPSVTGGGKSEDTVLVTEAGNEVLTRTPSLGEIATSSGVRRPAIVEL